MKMNKIKKTLGILLMTCVLLFASITQSEAATATMTQAERKVYTKWLLNGITKTQYGTYYKSKTQGIMYNPEFYVYDINGDGHKDIIVTGRLGLRTMTYSEVYMHVNGKYKAIPVRGSLYGVSNAGIYTIEDDYSSAGAVRYHTLSTYKFSKHGKISQNYTFSKTTMYYDIDRNIRYKNGKIIENKCTSSTGKKISLTIFRKARAQVSKKNVSKKMHPVSKSGIQKYLK